jgi:glycosyltransferase involved in cell wall biosynthesis
LAEVKDQHSLLSALHLLVSDQPALRDSLRLALIGDGPLSAGLRRAAEELGIADLVWMPGDREDIPELLQMLDVFVLPSLAEGISNTVLEAMASGLPVIATRTGGNPELIDDGDNGRLVPVSDPRALADAIAGMIAKPETIREMGERGREKVQQRFNWTRTVDDYLTVYDEVLAVGQGVVE